MKRQGGVRVRQTEFKGVKMVAEELKKEFLEFK